MRIIIAASGRGGHLFPALSLAQELKRNNFQIYFVLDKGGSDQEVIKRGFALESLSATSIKLNSLKTFFGSTIGLLKSFVESLAILRRVKPRAVVGFGGYASFPVVLLAAIKGIPTVIHEQNVIPGRANRMLSLWAGKIAISFLATQKYFNSSKTVFTGTPVREELLAAREEDALKEFNLEKDKFTILVMGGSQGSRRINQAFIDAASSLKDALLRPAPFGQGFEGLSCEAVHESSTAKKDALTFQVIHIAGRDDYDYVKNAYAKTNLRVCCIAFLEKMGYAYSIADLVISRAGASSLSEIAAFRIPSILVPYPFARNHQMANASVFRELGAAVIIEDKDLSGEKLRAVLSQLLSQKGRLKKMQEGFGRIGAVDAAKKLAQVVTSVIK